MTWVVVEVNEEVVPQVGLVIAVSEGLTVPCNISEVNMYWLNKGTRTCVSGLVGVVDGVCGSVRGGVSGALAIGRFGVVFVSGCVGCVGSGGVGFSVRNVSGGSSSGGVDGWSRGDPT